MSCQVGCLTPTGQAYSLQQAGAELSTPSPAPTELQTQALAESRPAAAQIGQPDLAAQDSVLAQQERQQAEERTDRVGQGAGPCDVEEV